jgi:hypothetical protein
MVMPNVTSPYRRNTMNAFLHRFGSMISGVLNGFDRLVFMGSLRSLVYAPRMVVYLSRVGLLIKDFTRWTQDLGNQIKDAAAQTARNAGRPVCYLPSSATSKEDLARSIAQRDGVHTGLIAVLSCVEPCHSFDVRCDRAAKKIELINRPRQCLHLYYYFMHPIFGFMHVRLQTWTPYTVRVSINGREWLARQMDQAGIAYVRRDNCFTWIEDVTAAQALMDQQLSVRWDRVLDKFVQQVNPIHQPHFQDYGLDYYWSVYQSEWASDVMFRDAADLARLYPRLARHGIETFDSGDVMRFLGRYVPADGHVNPRFAGEVVSDLKRRPEGMRIKHRVDANSIKLYDKQGSVLRAETTMNHPKDFKVYRSKAGQTDGPPGWHPLRKSVADIARRAEVSQKANDRYLEALAAVDDTRSVRELTEPLCRPTRWKGHRVRALNPLSPDDAALLQAVSRGEFTVNGLRNRDLCRILYASVTQNASEQRRRSAAVTRKLRLLRAHGLIHKVPHTHRYTVSPQGRLSITALLAAREATTQQLTKHAA